MVSLNLIEGAAQRTEGNQRSMESAALMLSQCPWTQGAKDFFGIGPVSVSCYSKDGLGSEDFHLLCIAVEFLFHFFLIYLIYFHVFDAFQSSTFPIVSCS